MRETDLPSPNIGARGFHLRRVAAQAISQAQVAADKYPADAQPDLTALRTFFTACLDAVPAGAAA